MVLLPRLAARRTADGSHDVTDVQTAPARHRTGAAGCLSQPTGSKLRASNLMKLWMSLAGNVRAWPVQSVLS